MNSWQIALEVRERLRTMTWPLGAQELVFGEEGAYVVAGMPEADTLPGGFPFAYIFAGPATADPDEPLFESVPFTVALVQMQEGDPLGEQAIIGGPRALSDPGTSRGRGILEIGAEVKSQIGKLTGADGLPVVWMHTGAPQTASLDGLTHLASLAPSFTILCTTFPVYTSPYYVQKSGDTLTWRAPPAVVGLIGYRVTADGVVLGSTTALTLTDPAIGLATAVTVAAGYSLTGGSVADAWSEEA